MITDITTAAHPATRAGIAGESIRPPSGQPLLEAVAVRIADVLAEWRDRGIAGRLVETDRLRLAASGFNPQRRITERPCPRFERRQDRVGDAAPAMVGMNKHPLDLPDGGVDLSYSAAGDRPIPNPRDQKHPPIARVFRKEALNPGARISAEQLVVERLDQIERVPDSGLTWAIVIPSTGGLISISDDRNRNVYIRMKLAVTENAPIIKPYDEARWAELADGRSAPISMSLDLLDGLHRRWVTFLRALGEDEFRRAFVHPELGSVAIFEALAMYAWHGRHHAAHIQNAISRSPARV